VSIHPVLARGNKHPARGKKEVLGGKGRKKTGSIPLRKRRKKETRRLSGKKTRKEQGKTMAKKKIQWREKEGEGSSGFMGEKGGDL